MSILVICSGCGRRFDAPNRLAGQSGFCPHCDAPIQVPRKPWLMKVAVILTAVVMLAAVGVSVAHWQGVDMPWLGKYFSQATTIDADLQYMPDDVQLVGSVNGTAFENSPIYKKLETQARQAGFDLDEMAKLSGGPDLSSAGVSRVTFGMVIKSFPASPAAVMVMTTRKPVNAEELKKLAGAMSQKKKGQTFSEVKVGRYTMHESNDVAFCRANDNTVVIGPSATLRPILERDKQAKISSTLRSALKRLDFTKSAMALAVDGQGIKQGMSMATMFNPFATGGRKGDDVEAITLQMDLSTSVDVKAVVTCQSAQTAKKMQKDFDDTLAQFRGMQQAGLPAEAITILNSIKTESKGGDFTVNLSVDNDTLVDLVKSVLPKLGTAAKKAMREQR
jgi:hypothetical protein